MHVMMFRARVKTEHVADVEEAAGKLFAAIDAAQPDGVKYLSTKLADGETFIGFLALDDPAVNPLAALAEFQAFQAGLPRWVAGPPAVEPLTIVGSYRLV